MELYEYLEREIDLNNFLVTYTELDLDKEFYIACFVPQGLNYIRDIPPKKAKFKYNTKHNYSNYRIGVQNAYKSIKNRYGIVYSLNESLDWFYSYLTFKRNGELGKTAVKHIGKAVTEQMIVSNEKACIQVFDTLEEAEAYYTQAKNSALAILNEKRNELKNEIDASYETTKLKYNL